jgi:hypothetical protein
VLLRQTAAFQQLLSDGRWLMPGTGMCSALGSPTPPAVIVQDFTASPEQSHGHGCILPLQCNTRFRLCCLLP